MRRFLKFDLDLPNTYRNMAVIQAEGPAANLRKRKSNSALNSDNIANGKSTALLKINALPTEHGQEMDKKLDSHQSSVVSRVSIVETDQQLRVWGMARCHRHDGWLPFAHVCVGVWTHGAY